MFYSIAIICLAAQTFSTAALSQSYPCYSLATSQYQSQAQIHTHEDFPVVTLDQNTYQIPLRGPAYTKTSSSEGGGAQTQPQQGDEETNKEKSKATSQSSDEDEDDYILDGFRCPVLTKNMFYCMMCGGSDENGKCKGVSSITIMYAITQAR